MATGQDQGNSQGVLRQEVQETLNNALKQGKALTRDAQEALNNVWAQGKELTLEGWEAIKSKLVSDRKDEVPEKEDTGTRLLKTQAKNDVPRSQDDVIDVKSRALGANTSQERSREALGAMLSKAQKNEVPRSQDDVVDEPSKSKVSRPNTSEKTREALGGMPSKAQSKNDMPRSQDDVIDEPPKSKTLGANTSQEGTPETLSVTEMPSKDQFTIRSKI